MDKRVKSFFCSFSTLLYSSAIQCVTLLLGFIIMVVFCRISQKYHGQGGKTRFLCMFIHFLNFVFRPPLFVVFVYVYIMHSLSLTSPSFYSFTVSSFYSSLFLKRKTGTISGACFWLLMGGCIHLNS